MRIGLGIDGGWYMISTKSTTMCHLGRMMPSGDFKELQKLLESSQKSICLLLLKVGARQLSRYYSLEFCHTRI